jgi:hypothetical protein
MSKSRGKQSKAKAVLKKRKVRAVRAANTNAEKRAKKIAERDAHLREHFAAYVEERGLMHFVAVEDGPPQEGDLVLVRLKNDVYRYGMVVGGQFSAHDYHSDQFVTFAHPDWITHWMKIIPPVDFPTAKAEAQTAQPEFLPPEHVESLEDEETP